MKEPASFLNIAVKTPKVIQESLWYTRFFLLEDNYYYASQGGSNELNQLPLHPPLDHIKLCHVLFQLCRLELNVNKNHQINVHTCTCMH